MDLYLLLFASYGLCFGLMNEKLPPLNRLLYAPPLFRNEEGQNFFERMFECAYCTGFHSGWLVWGAFWITGVESAGSSLGEMVLFALASSSFCYVLDTLLRWLER